MKRLVLSVLAVVPVLLTTACASGPVSRSDQEVDQQRVAAIEHVALQRGVKVMWISMPTKRTGSPG